MRAKVEHIYRSFGVGKIYFIFTGWLALCAFLTLIATSPEKLVPSPTFFEVASHTSGPDYFSLSYFYYFASNPILAVISGCLFCIFSVIGPCRQIAFMGVAATYYALHHSAIVPDGGDQIGLNMSLFCCFMAFGNYLLSTKNAIFQNIGHFIAFYSFVLMKLQMSFLYINAAIAKIRVDNWINGSEVYYSLLSPYFGVTGIRAWLAHPILESNLAILFLTWGTIAIELFIGIAIFSTRKAKLAGSVFVVLLHGSIAFFMGITSFSLIMAGCAIVALVPISLFGKDLSDVKKELVRE